jgi:two-component system, OmpR family, response regulator
MFGFMENGLLIAVVEDDPEIRLLLSNLLVGEGYKTIVADGGEALDTLLAQGATPDLVVLDWMLPGEDGLSICRRLRTGGGPPIIMLTAKGDDIDRILGLEIGADDYVTKPFNPRVLLAHIRAVLRRTLGANATPADTSGRLRVADLVIDPPARRVLLDNRDLELTGAEFDLLLCFVERPQRVLSREQLLDWTRGRVADVFDRTIDVQVSRLRRRLEESGSAIASSIKTVRNAGYILSTPVTPA